MRPLYEINSKILGLIASISEKIGEVNASFLVVFEPAKTKPKTPYRLVFARSTGLGKI